MRIKLSDIPEGTSTSAGAVKVGSIDPGAEEGLGGEIGCRAEIERMGSHIRFLLVYRGTVQLRCSRCLTPYQVPVEGEIRLVHRESSSPVEEEEEQDEQEEEDAASYVSDGYIDLAAAVCDEVLTDMPMKPLCSPRCTGGEFTPGSGEVVFATEENEGTDPRWEPLRGLGQDKRDS